ncbi:MAG: nucleotidyltransferase family protein [Gammaproteobacteria bacterium]
MHQGADAKAIPCIAVILAAGKGSRYGDNKITAAKIDGVPIGLITARLYQQCLPTIVVIRDGDTQAKALFESASITTVTAHKAHLGMGNSLSAGVREAAALGAEHCLIALADMPWVKESTVRTLVERLLADNTIVRPRYKGIIGNPVGFPQQYFGELIKLSEDRGAKRLLAAHQDSIIDVDVDDSGVILDIDTPGDLRATSE